MLDMHEVTGSSPVPPTTPDPVRIDVHGVLLCLPDSGQIPNHLQVTRLRLHGSSLEVFAVGSLGVVDGGSVGPRTKDPFHWSEPPIDLGLDREQEDAHTPLTNH